jgi:Putative Actinobacterial Holin-X, holin superfamily III
MAYEALRNSTLPRALADVLRDVSDLLQKEVRLARAEINHKIASGAQAGIWMGGAALLFLVAAVLVVEAAVFALATAGIPLPWACLLVAVAIAIIGALALAYGRSAVRETLTPARSIKQINEDVRTVKENLS